LFNLILGKLEASQGDIDFPSDWQVGYMAQEVEATDRPGHRICHGRSQRSAAGGGQYCRHRRTSEARCLVL
jgi:ATPase subunit of ABC transporter with duplicated ATPase domains